MEKCSIEAEELFEKCRAVLSVLDRCPVDGGDRDTLIWIARDYLEQLGKVIGITRMT